MHFTAVEVLISAFLFINSVHASPLMSRQSDVTACLDSHNVTYSIEGSSDWTALTTPYNRRLVYVPAVVTIPTTPEDVSWSVQCAAASSLKVQAKGGGHSYASYSSGGQNGSLIIEMENFNSVTVNPETFVATIGSGQRLGNVATALFNQGGRALPHGTCAGVGIAGHALHGGYGYASRKWGITLDHIIGLDVVLANGTQIYTDNATYPDIFYAMRGAGDSFGIVTYFYMATEEAPSSVVYFTAGLASSLSDVDVVTAGFENLQNFSLNSELMSDNLTFGMYTDSGGSFSLSGWCMSCDIAQFNSTVFPVMLKGFTYSSTIVKSQDWITALTNLASPEPLKQPLGSAYTLYDTFYAKSLVSKNTEPLTTDAIQSFWSYIIANQGKGPFYSIINLYGGLYSAINTPSPDSSAYSDRDALWVFQNFGYTANNLPPYDEAITPLVDGLNDAVTNAQPGGNFTAYLNYVDPDLTPTQAAQEYYGTETYNKLLGIKIDVDPAFVFWNPQAIGLSPVL